MSIATSKARPARKKWIADSDSHRNGLGDIDVTLTDSLLPRHGQSMEGMQARRKVANGFHAAKKHSALHWLLAVLITRLGNNAFTPHVGAVYGVTEQCHQQPLQRRREVSNA
jgi:hypothetical protein